MQINYVAIVLATIVQFMIGAVWYSVFFGKLWGKMHGFDKLPKDVQQEMMKSMGPYYMVQAFVTLLTSAALAVLITSLPEWNPYILAALVWIGFVVPTQVSSVIFGGTPKEWIVKKIAVQVGCILICLEVAAAIISFLG
jgi:hypothetical protein